MENVDENTIAVGAVLGTTFTGAFNDVKKINSLLVYLSYEEVKLSDIMNELSKRRKK